MMDSEPHKGNRPNAVFEKKAWNQIRDEFNRQTNLDFNNNQLRKHLDVLRARYHSLQPDYNQNDTSQDPCYTMNFDMWEDIAAQSKLEPATTNDYLIYQQFRTIFADTNLDGKYAQSSHYRELDKSNPLVAGDVLPKTLDFLEQNVSSSKDTSDRKRKCLSEASSASERIGWSQELSNAMAGAILDMINCSTLQEVAKPVIDEGFSISNCIKALDKIEGIDNHLYYAALELCENLTFREDFISLKGNYARLMWLQEKCGLIYASS